jgi:hypothetical protein
MPKSEFMHLIQPPNVLMQNLDGEAVLLNLENGKYYGLDENSFHMYKTLLSSSTVDAAYEVLAGEYNVDPIQLKKDLDLFISHLVENGLLVDAGELPAKV